MRVTRGSCASLKLEARYSCTRCGCSVFPGSENALRTSTFMVRNLMQENSLPCLPTRD